MKDEIISGTIGTSLGIIGTATQINDLLKTISLILTIIGAIITYIIVPLLAWYKNAKKDGKITAEEIKDGVELIENGANKVVDETKKKEGK